MKVNEKLKLLRKNSGYSQEKLAEYLKIDQTTLSKIENGERTVTLGILSKLSELYSCTLESLIDENAEPEIIKLTYRSKDATSDDFCQIARANKIILNMKEMLEIRDKNE